MTDKQFEALLAVLTQISEELRAIDISIGEVILAIYETNPMMNEE